MKGALEYIELGRIERIHALRSLFGQSGPSTAALAALAGVATPVRIPAGSVIAQEGAANTKIWVVVQGELIVERHAKLLGHYGPRNVVGSLAALARDPRGFHCHASQDTVALELRADDMLEMFEDHFAMLQIVMETIAQASIELRRKLTPHAGYDGELGSDPEHLAQPLDLVERMLTLRKILAVHSHIDELAELARAAQEVHYLAGTPLWYEGERSGHMLVLVSGSVNAWSADGLAFRFAAGDLVGGLDMVAGTPRWYTAIAERKLIALSIDRETLLDLCEDQAELGFDFLRLLSEMLLSLSERTATQPGLMLEAQAEPQAT